MDQPRQLHALILGGAIAATFLGCSDAKAPPDAASPPSVGPTATPGPGKPADPITPTTAAPAPAVIDQPAAPSTTPADAAHDKAKAGAGAVKQETPPSNR